MVCILHTYPSEHYYSRHFTLTLVNITTPNILETKAMDTEKYWIHVVYPHDEDQGPTSLPDDLKKGDTNW